jgi:hypothetical protein
MGIPYIRLEHGAVWILLRQDPAMWRPVNKADQANHPIDNGEGT